MADTYPLDFSLVAAERTADLQADLPILNALDIEGPFHGVTTRLEALTDEEVKRFVLASISNWPEVKTMMKTECVVIFGRRICTKVPVVYQRLCKKEAYVEIAYPLGQEAAIRDCVYGAGLAAVVAAVISGGAAAAAAFQAVLIECLEAKGEAWASQVRVSAGWDSTCGKWH